MPPLVSILIPAYNAEQWIGDTIRSALAQTWPNKEIIIVDDGSSDRTAEIAKQFAASNVSIVTQKNQGAPSARNKAFELCQGDYIQWLDADDLLSPNKVGSQMAVAERSQDKQMLLSCKWGSFTHRPWRAKFISTPLCCDLDPLEWMLRKWEQNLHMQTATWLVSRQLSESAGPWDTRLMGDDDGEYFCRVLLRSSGVRFVPDAKVYYRITGSSRWSYIGLSNKKMEAHVLGMRLQINYVRAVSDSERVRSACVNYLQTWLIYFYPERPDLVNELRELARALGGDLKIPTFSWKYYWIEKLFGFAAAKHTQLVYNQAKSSVLGASDKVMCLIDPARRASS
jgi:glycosyltransferase involved in cell wall biosynthesis